MSYELIAILMFGVMLLMLITGQRVFAAIGFVASGMVLMLYGTGGIEIPFSQSAYSLIYLDSERLDYNEKKQKIHRNYNKWITLLSRTINDALASKL